MSGARREWLASNDFVMIHLDLVDLGLSWEAAALLHRIHFRSGGAGWWYATKEQMQADIRLTEWKLRQAVELLREHGMIEWERQSATNPTLRWRVVFADSDPTPIPHSRDGGILSQEDEGASVSSTKNDKKKDSSSSGDDGGEDSSATPAPNVTAHFDAWWAVYPRKVGKKAAAKAYEKAAKDATPAALFEGLEAHLPYWRGKDADHIPHPSTWLNEGRWEDRPDAPAPDETKPEGDDPTAWMRRRP